MQSQLPYALQLYSVRDALARDLSAALREVRDAGYECVELAGLYDRTPAEFNALLENAGLSAVSAHVPFEQFLEGVDTVLGALDALDLRFAVIPWLNPSEETRVWEERAAQMDVWGARLAREGIRLGYHNHDHEFRPMNGRTPFDLIFQIAAPDHLFAELDAGWSAFAGVDTPALIRRYTDRMPLLHLKQFRDAGPDPVTVELASGLVDWREVAHAARDAGVQWYIVEQDESPAPMESARKNAAFMRTLA